MTQAKILTGLLLLLLLTGCLATLTTPDFGSFYDPAAAERHPDRNPVIVIPGFLGSRLVDADSGKVVWGEVGGEYADPVAMAAFTGSSSRRSACPVPRPRCAAPAVPHRTTGPPRRSRSGNRPRR